MFEERSLSPNELKKILALQEGQFLDFKSFGNNKPILKTLSSLANADGGEIYIGVGDSREQDRLSTAFKECEEANGLIHESLGMFSDGPEFIKCEFLRLPIKRLIILALVQKTPFVVKTPGGQVFRRQNASDRLIQQSELTRLELDKGVHSAENKRINAEVSDLDNSKIGQIFVENTVPTMDLKALVTRERLTADGFLRLGAALLFLDYPQPLIPYASVKIYRYKSLEIEGSRKDLAGDPITIEGPIYEQIKASVSKTKEIIEGIPILGSSGLSKIKYPDEAIHEVICNAILHRDYSISDYVHVRVFDNRVEVESPGRFAGHITPKNILESRFARNNQITRLTAKFPEAPNKDVGEGLNTTFRAMQNLNLKRPTIKERDSYVLVSLAHEPLASKEEMIKQYLEANETINNTRARELFNIASDSVIRKIFSQMMEAREIEKVPGTTARGTKYRLRRSDVFS